MTLSPLDEDTESTGDFSPVHLVIVQGVARSKYAKSARKYERKVNLAATKIFDAPLSERDLSVAVRHFYTSGNTLDLDNLLKSILDGLKGAAYHDDSQIAYVSARRYNISESYAVEDLAPAELDALAQRRDFVVIRISHIKG